MVARSYAWSLLFKYVRGCVKALKRFVSVLQCGPETETIARTAHCDLKVDILRAGEFAGRMKRSSVVDRLRMTNANPMAYDLRPVAAAGVISNI